VEKDLKKMVTRNGHAVFRDRKKWRRIVLEAKVHIKCSS
jgi:hypothetical protein